LVKIKIQQRIEESNEWFFYPLLFYPLYYFIR